MQTKNPWIVKERKEIYKDKWMSVFEDTLIDGKKWGIVDFGTGVFVLPIDSDGYVYLVNELYYINQKYFIKAVGGGVGKDEDPQNAAKRELKEELGIDAREWTSLGNTGPIKTTVKSSAYMFLAQDLEFGKTSREETEIMETVKIKFDDAVKMVMENKINHGMTCLLILKAKYYLDNLGKF